MTSVPRWAGRILPGLLLCIVITLVAGLLQHVEESTLGRAWLESLVLSIINDVDMVWFNGTLIGANLLAGLADSISEIPSGEGGLQNATALGVQGKEVERETFNSGGQDGFALC